MAEVFFIPLTHGFVAKVDAEDYARVAAHKWHTIRNRGGALYASARIEGVHWRMHRFILRAKQSVQIDHANSDGLDNRRVNLRECTASQNVANTRKRIGCVSSFKGVSLRRDKLAAGRVSLTWRARITCNNRNVALGIFKNEEEAALAYDQAAKQMFGEFARLNFPDGAPVPHGQHHETGAVLCLNQPVTEADR